MRAGKRRRKRGHGGLRGAQPESGGLRKAAAEYRNRAEEIQNRAREALRNAPEPERAYCIVLAGDYAAAGENVFAALKLYASERFECVEGDREEYVFFWFEDQGQAVQVTCYYDFTVMMERLKEGSLPLSRLVPLFSESYGLTETMRLCMEQAWESGCSTMLPVFVLFGEEDELSRLVQMDLLSYARGTGGCSHPGSLPGGKRNPGGILVQRCAGSDGNLVGRGQCYSR